MLLSRLYMLKSRSPAEDFIDSLWKSQNIEKILEFSWRINGVSWIFQELISHMVPRLFNTYLDEVLEWRSFFFHSSEIWCVSLIDFLFSSSFLWNPLDVILLEIGKVRVWSPPQIIREGPKRLSKYSSSSSKARTSIGPEKILVILWTISEIQERLKDRCDDQSWQLDTLLRIFWLV